MKETDMKETTIKETDVEETTRKEIAIDETEMEETEMEETGVSKTAVNKTGIEIQIANQCAPLLFGVKGSNILITNNSNRNRVYDIFHNTSIKVKNIYSSSDRTIMFLYKPYELNAIACQADARKLMRSVGYQYSDPEEVLNYFVYRYQIYRRERGLFPHEMGILLGYPFYDVVGFMENKGKNYLYSGYWKVYSNLPKALKTFENYYNAKQLTVQLVSLGFSIQEILLTLNR